MNAGQSVGSDLVVDIREHVRVSHRVPHFGVGATKPRQLGATRLEGNATINVTVNKLSLDCIRLSYLTTVAVLRSVEPVVAVLTYRIDSMA